MDSTGKYSEVFWYHTELNGLPERMTNHRGDVIWRGRFSLWGETEYENSGVSLNVPQNLRFQGQYLDRESGLHYNLFRYYDPAGGRFTQSDPIGLAGGLNTYAYVGDPLTWVDPLGLSSFTSNSIRPAQPEKIVNALRDYRSKDFHFVNQKFKLDKAGMKHILERHHPDYWDGSIKTKQSFLLPNISIEDVENSIFDVMKENREVLVTKGTLGKYQITGASNGIDYVVGFKNGRIGQFYPK